MNQQTIDIGEFPPDLRMKIKSLISQNALVLLVDGGEELGQIVPAGTRIPGLDKNGVWIADDFDDPLPDDF